MNIFNLGTDEYCAVDDSLGWICTSWASTRRRDYTGGERGWIGDSPFIFLDTQRCDRSAGSRSSRSARAWS